MIEGLASTFYTSKHPHVVACRAFLERHPAVLDAIRRVLSAIRSVRSGVRSLRERIRDPIGPLARAVLDARRIGGPLSLSDMEKLWHAAARCKPAVAVGAGPGLDQIVAILRRRAGLI